MRDTISGGRRFIGCRELVIWSIAFRNCNAWDLRVLVCKSLRLAVWNDERRAVSYLRSTEASENPTGPCLGFKPGNFCRYLPIQGGKQLRKGEV